MLNLDTTSALVRIITSGTADIDVAVSYTDYTSPSTIATANQNTLITTATTTTIASSPSGSAIRNVKGINIRNSHASSSNTITVEHTDGTTAVELFKVTLQAGEVLVMNDAGVWFVYDANGGVKMGASAASDTVSGLIEIADQSEMESASSTQVAVTPGRLHFHPAAAKCWVEAQANSTTILASYNITSLTDTATGTMTVTIATDFSSANWCCQCSRSEDDLTLVYSCTYNAKAAGSVALNSVVEAGSGSDPTSSSGNASWSMCGFGDHA